MEVIAIAYSDSHNHNFRQFNINGDRIEKNLMVQERIFGLAKNLDVPILFGGDMFHNPTNLSNVLLDKVAPKLKSFHEEIISYNITGNHDQCFPNTFEKQSPSYIKTFSELIPNMHCIDFKSVSLTENDYYGIHGLPYLSLNKGFKSEIKKFDLSYPKNILLIHTDLPGAKDTNHREVGTAYNIDYKLFKPFDLVLSGHIHLPQELVKDKVLMMGAPNQQRKSDYGEKYGCWLIYDDLSYEFVDLEGPEFIELEHDEKPPKKDNWNMYYHKPTPKKQSKQEAKTDVDTRNIKKLVKGYFKYKGIKDKDKRVILETILKNHQ